MTDIPMAIHRGESDLPFVDLGEGIKIQVLQVNIDAGLWVVRNKFAPGTVVQKHKHTGEVFAFTQSGSWKYAEYPEVNTAGSFLYEPAGSVHTLECLEPDTQVWFHMYGVNMNLDADGNVESVFDGPGTLEVYLALAEAEGFGRPDVLVA